MANQITVGNVDIKFVLDMLPPPRDPSVMFPTTDSHDWEPYHEALEDCQLQLYYGHFYLRSMGKTIMVDTGMGPGPHPSRANRTGDMINQLKISGVNPEDVDLVLITHMHIDHVGWNIDYSGSEPKPTFPNARYLAPQLDWDHFTKPEFAKDAPWVEENILPLEKMGLLDLIGDGYVVNDEITAISTPGHTPGHMVFDITSQGEKAMVVGDLLHSRVQIEHPEWTAGVDTDKEASQKNRTMILERAESEDIVIAAGHFHPDDHIGKVIRLEGKRYWQVIK
ncbi:MAG: MBL fold metallo-hydrolase [Dehalococcoidia bacterium]|nr:MBL fold metallo-hydrolase [Dehalococcoidia bacterium]